MTGDNAPSANLPVVLDDLPHETPVDDGDSTVDGVSALGSTESLTDSILDYRRIHGRTFTAKGEYWGPNDERQNEGLDIAHHWHSLLLDDKFFLAPIKDPKTILDVGTGTGLWAIDVADQFPDASVIGIDLSPIQPSWVPPNCQFVHDDAEADWTWPEDHFSYIHMRNLEACIADWPALYRRAFRHTAPGGWLEVAEFDITPRSQTLELDEKHPFRVWGDAMFLAADKIGKTLRNWENDGIKKGLEAAGFVDVVRKRYRVPVCGWSSDKRLAEIGMFVSLYLNSSIDGFALYLLNVVLGWQVEEMQAMVAKMRTLLNDPKNTPYFELYVVYGRKPEAAS